MKKVHNNGFLLVSKIFPTLTVHPVYIKQYNMIWKSQKVPNFKRLLKGKTKFVKYSVILFLFG